jgi:hypothetical protein
MRARLATRPHCVAASRLSVPAAVTAMQAQESSRDQDRLTQRDAQKKLARPRHVL